MNLLVTATFSQTMVGKRPRRGRPSTLDRDGCIWVQWNNFYKSRVCGEDVMVGWWSRKVRRLLTCTLKYILTWAFDMPICKFKRCDVFNQKKCIMLIAFVCTYHNLFTCFPIFIFRIWFIRADVGTEITFTRSIFGEVMNHSKLQEDS